MHANRMATNRWRVVAGFFFVFLFFSKGPLSLVSHCCCKVASARVESLTTQHTKEEAVHPPKRTKNGTNMDSAEWTWRQKQLPTRLNRRSAYFRVHSEA